jgi:hypothetical protein
MDLDGDWRRLWTGEGAAVENRERHVKARDEGGTIRDERGAR